jgi:hypothetical protein
MKMTVFRDAVQCFRDAYCIALVMQAKSTETSINYETIPHSMPQDCVIFILAALRF